MKKTILLLSLLVMMLGAYFLFFYDKGGSTRDKDEIAFAIQDTAKVDRIVMSRIIQGEEVERRVLERNPQGGWTLDGTHGAVEPKVKTLLGTLHLIHVREVLKKKGKETALKMLDANHLLLEAFSAEGLMKSIKVGIRTRDSKGTVMMLAGAENPYIVMLPGFEGYPSAMMTTEFEVWRENLLFNEKPETIAEVRIEYGSSHPSVQLAKEESSGNWSLKGVENQVDSARVMTYLNQFQGKVYGLSFVDKAFPNKIDTLKSLPTEIVFTVKNTQGESRQLNLFSSGKKGSNYFGWIEGENELRAIQPFVIDKYLAKREDFLP